MLRHLSFDHSKLGARPGFELNFYILKLIAKLLLFLYNQQNSKCFLKLVNFLGKPDLEEFDHLKKEDLVLLAKHLKIDFKVSMRKQTIKILL